MTHYTTAKAEAEKIYHAIDSVRFEKKYGFSLELALAAPELLEALKELHLNTLYRLSEDDKRYDRPAHTVYDKVEAAIKKATL